MPTVEVAERAGTVRSEDRVVVLPQAIVLLDGATMLTPREQNGGWYAERLANELARRLPGRGDDLRAILAEAISTLVSRHDLTPGDSPSSTVALLRWDDEIVEALVLADSPVVAFTDSGVRPVTDDRLAGLRSSRRSSAPDSGDQAGRGGATSADPPRAATVGAAASGAASSEESSTSRGFRERLRTGGGFDGGHREALGAAMSRTARLRNVPGGFWVAEALPAAAWEAVVSSWPRSEVREVLLASDGVSCGVDDYGLFADWNALADRARTAGVQAVLDDVRAAEESDPDGRRWPRAKRHDDQSLVRVVLG
ncbi:MULTISPECIES: protein phosphatase 2C domain-containing protein [Actinoalloteichus]|uniref:Protein phosphatase 2C-like protein n=1 Tax=Actinoalloteichus fjordicus TaxID=1612552 RepID=A0AAC9LJD6_9PSEU|nr:MULTISPECIES: protein phosphatase 2C domain-containing protein [Actinoalloteichus]APU17747.1 hypothetical protein UA74_28755 [Actinoalloteichus fjordicus]APU23825.1 hypothetical protein UA75_29285 [Actinoalloteichus sp. GBA129-24]